jgi:copper chaperone CopZ
MEVVMRAIKVLAVLLVCAIASPVLAQQPVGEPTRLAPGIVVVAVEDMHCATCAKKVARKLYAVKGVKRVAPSLEKDVVTVHVPADQPVAVVTIWSAVAASGVKPVELRFGTERFDAEAIEPLLAAARASAVH